MLMSIGDNVICIELLSATYLNAVPYFAFSNDAVFLAEYGSLFSTVTQAKNSFYKFVVLFFEIFDFPGQAQNMCPHKYKNGKAFLHFRYYV